jgi:hypothetical protein
MNRIYRLVWRESKRAWVPAPEIARRRRKGSGSREAVIVVARVIVTVSLFAQGANAVLAAGTDSSTRYRVVAVKYW